VTIPLCLEAKGAINDEMEVTKPLPEMGIGSWSDYQLPYKASLGSPRVI